MALNPHFGLAARNDALDTVDVSVGTTALLVMFAGLQPADASAATTAANVSVANLTLTSTSTFGAAAAGVLSANAIGDDTSAAGGSANWFAIEAATGARVIDGEVGTAGSDINLNSQAITTGATVSITSFTVTFAQ